MWLCVKTAIHMNYVIKYILKGGADSASLTLSEPVEFMIREFQVWVGKVGFTTGRHVSLDDRCGKEATASLSTADTERKPSVR